MPSFVKNNKDVSKEVTRKLAQRVVSTLKKIGASKKVTLKNVQQYINEKYSSTPQKIAKMDNELKKALSSGAASEIDKRTHSYRKPKTVTSLIMEARRRRRRRGRGRHGRRRRSRSRGRK